MHANEFRSSIIERMSPASLNIAKALKALIIITEPEHYHSVNWNSLQNGLTARTGNYIHRFVWDVIIHPHLNTLRPILNGRHFPDDIFIFIFLNENVWISVKISLKFVPKGPINNIPALIQIMAWRRPGDKPLSEAMLVSLLTHICVTRPRWVNIIIIIIILAKLPLKSAYNIVN